MLKKILTLSALFNLILLSILFFLIYSLGGLQYVWFKTQNRGVSGVYAHRKMLFEELEIKKESIVFLGNSITEQCEWAELFENPSIVNRGIAMDNTTGLLERLDPVLSAQPELVFLMIGVNDLIASSPEKIAENYRKILLRFKRQSPAGRVVVQSVLPVNNRLRNTHISNQDILALNEQVRVMAEEFEYPYVDLHAVLKDSEGQLDQQYSIDGIHLNGKAYLKWKSELIRLGLIPEIYNRETWK